MLVLFETPAGFALFKVNDESKLKKPDNLVEEFQSLDKAKKLVTLKDFRKFEDTADALAAATGIVEGKVSKNLKSFLRKSMVKKDLKEKLAVADAKLAGSIKEKLGIECVADNSSFELIRCIRSQLDNLLSDNLPKAEMHQMVLGLSHSLSRYKLKFSPDKVDTMIVQAISLLDDLDKELNIYAMRVKEWYGWHFPELVRVVTDNLQYAKTAKLMGDRNNANTTDLSDILEEKVALDVKEAAKVSMGTEVRDEDLSHVRDLCDQVIDITEYREQLFDYIKNRMRAIAPNLTILVGELVGARLIAHAGSLLSLAKHPASTVQILGAEKALFRALKTKKNTPKYGLIYHVSLVGQATPKNKGKVSRMLANKAALAIRVDALGDKDTKQIGSDSLVELQQRAKELETGRQTSISGRKSTAGATPQKYQKPSAATPTYNTAGDVSKKEKKSKDDEMQVEAEQNGAEDKKDKKKKDKKDKKRKRPDTEEEAAEEPKAKKAKKSDESEKKKVKKDKKDKKSKKSKE